MADDLPSAVTPYARARQLSEQSIAFPEILKTLVAEGLDHESAQIVVQALSSAPTAVVTEDPPHIETAVPPPTPTHHCPRHADFPVTGTCSRCGAFFCAKCVQEAALPTPSEPSTWCPDCRTRFPQKMAIGGWLLLPALHLLASPVVMIKGLYTDVHALMGRLLPGFFAPVVIEAAITMARLMFCVFVAVRFFQRRRQATALCIAFYVVMIAFALFEIAMAEWIRSLTGKAGTDQFGALVQTMLGGILWITYFMRSQRVRATFVEE